LAGEWGLILLIDPLDGVGFTVGGYDRPTVSRTCLTFEDGDCSDQLVDGLLL